MGDGAPSRVQLAASLGWLTPAAAAAVAAEAEAETEASAAAGDWGGYDRFEV